MVDEESLAMAPSLGAPLQHRAAESPLAGTLPSFLPELLAFLYSLHFGK